MVSIKAVADRAGVSIASVSRVINGTVARKETELRVRTAIKELGYQPNSAARALKIRQSEQICLSFDDLANPAYVAMTRGVGQALAETKYRLILASAFSSVEEIVKHLETMGRGFADGLIISPIYADKRIAKLISHLQIPVVLVGTMPVGLNVDNVYVDSAIGIGLGVDHLKATNRKRIGLVNGPIDTNPGRRRRIAFESAMKEMGLKYSEESVIQADAFSISGGYEAVSKFRNLDKFDGLICGNDQIAAGVLKYCYENGIAIPGDLALIGIDNIDLASILHPTLTSIDLHSEKRGEIAAQLMLERLADPARPIQKINVKPTLVIRESTAA